jgi:hypothetical protein
MVDELHGILLAESGSLAESGVLAGSGATLEKAVVFPDAVPEPVAANGEAPTALVALPDGERYHTASCPAVRGKERATMVTLRTIRRRSLTPCPLCEPAPVAG